MNFNPFDSRMRPAPVETEGYKMAYNNMYNIYKQIVDIVTPMFQDLKLYKSQLKWTLNNKGKIDDEYREIFTPAIFVLIGRSVVKTSNKYFEIDVPMKFMTSYNASEVKEFVLSAVKQIKDAAIELAPTQQSHFTRATVCSKKCSKLELGKDYLIDKLSIYTAPGVGVMVYDLSGNYISYQDLDYFKETTTQPVLSDEEVDMRVCEYNGERVRVNMTKSKKVGRNWVVEFETAEGVQVAKIKDLTTIGLASKIG